VSPTAAEFLDTNVLVYAFTTDPDWGARSANPRTGGRKSVDRAVFMTLA
jgi:hypothetical protein